MDAKEERSDCDLLCRRRAYENADGSCLAQATGECETSVGDDEVGEDVQSVPVGEDDSLRGLERSLRYEDCSSGMRRGLSARPGVCPGEEGMGSGGRAFLGACWCEPARRRDQHVQAGTGRRSEGPSVPAARSGVHGAGKKAPPFHVRTH